MGIDSKYPGDDEREVLFEHGGLKYDNWGIAMERSGNEEKLAQQRLADNAQLIERCKEIKSRLPKSAPPLNQEPLPLTAEEEEQVRQAQKMYKESGRSLSREEAIERSHFQRRYAMTPVKRQNDYDHAACGIEGANYEDRLIKALLGHPSEEFGGAFDWLVRTYTPEHFGVSDTYGLGEYVAELKKLHDALLTGMRRASDSTYRFVIDVSKELRQ